MNKHYKLFIIFSIIITVIFSVKLYDEKLNTEKIKALSIQYEAQSIADFLVAFRMTYQEIFTRNHTTLNVSNIYFLPIHTINEIAKIFSNLNTKSKISTVSNRPRNPINQANGRQREAINYFLENRNKASYFQTIEKKHYYSQPLYITKTCLKCHGEKENAPDIIKNNYDKSYNYKLGDLKGIIDIEINQTKLSLLLESSFKHKLLLVSILWIIIILFTFLYARHNQKLEKLIQEKEEKERKKDQQLLQHSRMAQMGEMIAMIAHQWRQPLAAISATSASIELKANMGRLDNNTAAQKARDISDFSQHLSGTIDDFRDFFKPNKVKEKVTFSKIIESSLKIVHAELKSKNILVEKDYKCEGSIDVYVNELRQVTLNLIKNAEDALLEQEIKSPTITIRCYSNEHEAILEVSDNAGGIPEEIIAKIFDPYFSTKTKKEGTGLGLYMSKTIIEEHCGGELSVSNGDDGAIFKIILGEKK